MNRKLLLFIIAIVIIAVGAVMANTMGFNKAIEYGEYTRVLVYMNRESNLNDINGLLKDTFDGKYEIAYIDEFKDTVSIKAQGISEEQITEFKNKLKEKYEFEDETEFMVTLETANVGTYELIKDYIKPVAISFVIILIYFGIAYRKLGILEGLVEPGLGLIVLNCLYVSIIAICRIPLNAYIIPLGVFIYIMSIIGATIYLNGKNKADV